MQEYLAFVDEIGKTSDGNYIYRFDFTTNTDVVWGDYFNIAPAIIVPDIQPDINCLSSRAKCIFPKEMEIAKKNSCFSMQDCIDGIIALFFTEIDDEPIMVNNKPLFFMFGESFNTVKDYIEKAGLKLYDIEIVSTGDDSIIDNLIDNDMLYDDGEE